MAVLDAERPSNNEPEKQYTGHLETPLPEGATFKQILQHIEYCKTVDTFHSDQISQLQKLTKELHALYIGMQIAATRMAKQEFGGFPTNIDGV
jgi:5,10-methylene-tetrahydrofolate dehydrogenase/methenyl tetrahydrofolate cyclohydrolase